jgi:hypothetical protein
MGVNHNILTCRIPSLLLLSFFLFFNCAVVQSQRPLNSNHNIFSSEADISFQFVHNEFEYNRNNQIFIEDQKYVDQFKNSKIETFAKNVLLKTSEYEITYQFALYDTTLLIEFNTTFEIESPDNYHWFVFDVNNNGKADPEIDKSYASYSYKELTKQYLYDETSSFSYNHFPSSASFNYTGDIKSMSYNIPVNEITTQKSISLLLWAPYRSSWTFDFSKAFTIQLPESIKNFGTLFTKEVSDITQNSCLAGSNVSSNGNYVISETGIIWSNNEYMSLEYSLGKIINTSGLSEFTAKIDGLRSNTKYFYRAYAITNDITFYGNVVPFRTEIESSQFTSLDKNILISNSGKNIIALVSEEDFKLWCKGFASLQSIFIPLYSKMNDDFDFVFLIPNTNEQISGSNVAGYSAGVSNSVKGIGKPIYDNSKYYGSSGRLKSFIWLPKRSSLKNGPSLHEIMHQWANYLIDSRALLYDNTSPSGLKEYKYGAMNGSHWGLSSVGGQLGGFDKLTTNVDGEVNKYQGTLSNRPIWWQNANGGNSIPYANLELYLMGLISPEEIIPVKFFYKLSAKNQDEFYNQGKFYSDSVVTFSAEKIMNNAGSPRIPDYRNSQKEFKALIVMVSPTMPTTDEIQDLDKYSSWLGFPGNDNENDYFNFYEATNGKATLIIDDYLKSLKNMPPVITFITPINGKKYSASPELEYKVTDTDLNTVTYRVNNGLKTMINPSGKIPLNLANGRYKLLIEATDRKPQTVKDSVSFEINNPPKIKIDSPIEGTTYDQNTSLQYTITDTDFNSASYTINGKGRISMAQNGTIQLYLDNRPYTIVIEATDNMPQTVKDSVRFTMNKPVGIEDSPLENKIGYYPNPVESILHIKYKIGISKNAYRTIYSPEGKPVEKKTIGNISEEDLDVTSYKSGMYILQIVDDKDIQEFKFIKK